VGTPCLFDQMGGKCAIDNAQGVTHDREIGKCIGIIGNRAPNFTGTSSSPCVPKGRGCWGCVYGVVQAMQISANQSKYLNLAVSEKKSIKKHYLPCFCQVARTGRAAYDTNIKLLGTERYSLSLTKPRGLARNISDIVSNSNKLS